MNRKIILVLAFLIVAGVTVNAQLSVTRYLVQFRDKGGNGFSLGNPSSFLSQRSIDRRARYNISLDSTDLPVTQRYIDSLRSVPNVTVLTVSKWLNQVSIRTTDPAALNKINSFPFVISTREIGSRTQATGRGNRKFRSNDNGERGMGTQDIKANVYNYGLSARQVQIHNGQFLHNIGLRGQNMIIGMLDGGFRNYLTLSAFDSARANGQILGTYDFVARETSVNEDHEHGMECLSTIAANIPGIFVGTAPKASFYLYRTEDIVDETPIEEHNWVCGAERLDSTGGDVISSSVGYYDFDAPFPSYTFSQLNGNITISARGADLAAKKGILVFQAAGNEGANSWGRIITPADGDSVFAVGAVDSSGKASGFTSRGPTADGQIKPDGASLGTKTIVQYPSGTITGNNGTSFATPNLAGLGTCLWQGFPEFSNVQVINAMRQSGSRATNPNDTLGYGITDIRRAFLLLTRAFSTASYTAAPCKVTVSWTSKDIAGMKYEIERKQTGSNNFLKVHERFGSGSTLAAHSYQYVDSLVNVTQGNILYRIRQIVDTAAGAAASDYIDSFTVNNPTNGCLATSINVVPGTPTQFQLLPNPTRGSFTLRIASPGSIPDLRIRIVDGAGRVVAQMRRSKAPGEVLIPVNLQLSAGKYYITLYKSGQMIGTETLLKL